MKTENPYFWDNYLQFPPAVQEQLIAEVKSLIPTLTVDEQADYFRGAQAEIILQFLKSLEWEAQVKIWKKYLPAGARDKAWKLISWEAKSRLKKRNHCLA
jgi:hypothetical protein